MISDAYSFYRSNPDYALSILRPFRDCEYLPDYIAAEAALCAIGWRLD